MISKSTAQAVIAEALKTGGDFAELFAQDSDQLTFSMLDGRVENIGALRDHGAGVRILLGTQCVYAYANDTSLDALLDTARQAAAALSVKATGAKPLVFTQRKTNNYSPIEIYPSDVTHKDKIGIMQTAHAGAKGTSAEVSQVIVRLVEIDSRILIFNSEGIFANDRQLRTRFVVQAVASSGTEFQTGMQGPGYSMGFEVFKHKIDAAQCGRLAAEQSLTMLHAPECPAAYVPVVIDGGFGGVIFHEACGHALESTSVSKGNSVFCNKLGQQIAAPCVSAVDDGTLPNEWGTLNMDDEGNPTHRNVLIENGILKSYMIDKLGGRRMGMEPTGNARRQSYAFAPTSRMTNTFIAPGKDDEQEMLTSMSEGLYAKAMGGGSVNPLTGEFNFSVLEGYWIKNGDIKPVRGATLIGKGADVLMKIDRVGKQMWLSAGVCGSISGNVPVCVGQPRIRVSGLTVGGKGGVCNGY